MALPIIVHNVPADVVDQEVTRFRQLGATKITIQKQADGTYTLTVER